MSGKTKDVTTLERAKQGALPRKYNCCELVRRRELPGSTPPTELRTGTVRNSLKGRSFTAVRQRLTPAGCGGCRGFGRQLQGARHRIRLCRKQGMLVLHGAQ